MTLYKSRRRFEGLSIKVGIAFSKLGLSANQWTGLTLIPTFIALYFLVEGSFLLAAVFFIVSAFFDLIDGSVARVTGTASKLGAYLDTIMDRYVEFLVVLGLLFVSLPDILLPVKVWVFLYLFGGLMTTYSKAAAKEKGLVEGELKGGLLERAERLLILFAGILLASIDTVFLSYILVLLAVLANLSALQRIWIAVRS